MKRSKIIIIKQVLFAFLFCIAISADAQKLPTEQQVSLRAPAGLKIDGKATEWNNQFQAYNHAADLFYTIANDDDKLYIIFQTEKPDVITKIISTGITFILDKSQKKDDKDGISITYPIYSENDRAYINVKNKPLIKKGSAASVIQADSFMNASNKRLTNKAKYVKITGVSELDTLVSVYNEYGIKASALFNNEMIYTCELSIPLKYLGLTANNTAKFVYHVKVNKVIPADVGVNSVMTSDHTFHVTISPGAILPTKDEFQAISATTDFWGEYTLAKQ